MTSKSTVTDGTYVGFIVLTFLGAVLAWTLVNSSDVVRSDGSRVIVMKHPTWKSEFLGLGETLKQDPWVVLLFPMFWSSNWFYTYQFNDVNGPYFSTRTSALNNVLYWLMQILGAFVFGYSLDSQRYSRPTKAKFAWVALFVLTMVIWGGGFAFQDYTRETTSADTFIPKVCSLPSAIILFPSSFTLTNARSLLGLEEPRLRPFAIPLHVLRLLRRLLADMCLLVSAYFLFVLLIVSAVIRRVCVCAA